jgi:threonine/homoserine/homoserine lactone efflux protein
MNGSVPDPSACAAFATASLALLLVPGPTVLFVLGRTLGEGRRAGLRTVLGVATGDSVNVVAATIGLSALLASTAAAFNVVRFVGAAYLVWLGVRQLRAKDRAHELATAPRRRALLDAFTVSALNPKTTLFFLAFLPQFVDPARNTTLETLVLGGIFVLLGLVTNSAWALTSGALTHHLRSHLVQRWRPWLSGGILIGLGFATAASGGRHR